MEHPPTQPYINPPHTTLTRCRYLPLCLQEEGGGAKKKRGGGERVRRRRYDSGERGNSGSTSLNDILYFTGARTHAHFSYVCFSYTACSSVCLSVSLSVCLSVCLTFCLSVCL